MTSQDKHDLDRDIDMFYKKVIEYIENWSLALDGTEVFKWMTKPLDWDLISKSHKFAIDKVGSMLSVKIDGKCENSNFHSYRQKFILLAF